MSNSIAELEGEYVCEEGYEQKGTECEKEEVIEARASNNCQSGYTYNNGAGKCEKQEEVNATTTGTCPEGYTYNASNDQCEKKLTAQATVYSTCPSGYESISGKCWKLAGKVNGKFSIIGSASATKKPLEPKNFSCTKGTLKYGAIYESIGKNIFV